MRFRFGLLLGVAGFALAGCAGGSSGVTPSGGSGERGISQNTAAHAWSVYDYNPSGRALAPEPATVSGATISFNFAKDVYTATLMTSDKSLTGDLSGKTALNATISVSGVSPTATFKTQYGGGCLNPPAVRFYFTTPGFAYTNYWWSDSAFYVLASGTTTISAPLNPALWSDWDGKSGTTAPAEFAAALAKVSQIGFSFGGDCFFENGATTTDGSGTFSTTFSES